MKRLSGLDASFLYMETPTTHLHVGGFGIFEPTGESPDSVFERTLELCAERVHLDPVFRQRLAMVPLQIHHPVLVDDPDFAVERHVHRHSLPAPGGQRELGATVGEIMSTPLERDKPLWEVHLVDGLDDGSFASVTKMHHAIVDGIAGVELAMLLLDTEPDPPRTEDPLPPFEPEQLPSKVELLAHGLRSRLRQPLGAVKVVRSLARQGAELLRQQRRARKPDLNPPPAPFTAPRTSLNCAISPDRAYAFTSVPLADLKRIKDAHACTINDVVLAACAGALRDYFDQRNETLDRSLVGFMPVSVRDEESDDRGNKVSGMLVSLATEVDDPAERLGTIKANTAGAKQTLGAVGAETLAELADLAPPNLMTQAARLASRTHMADRVPAPFNVTISNVPGPQFPLYSLGARMTLMSPLGPIADGSALNITVASYDGQMTFGFHGCPDAVEDLWSLEPSTQDAVAELAKA